MIMNKLFMFLTETLPNVDAPVVEEAFDFWKWLPTIITPEIIATATSLLTTVIVVFKVVGIVRNFAKKNAGTIDDVTNAVLKKLDELNDLNITKVISPIADKIAKVENTEEILIKVLALQQENSPSSRIAILNLLQNAGQVKDNTIVEAQAKVEEMQKQEQENKEQALKELEEIEKVEKEKEVAGRF